MFSKIKELYEQAEDWVHRQDDIVSSITHFAIAATFGIVIGLPLALVAGAVGAAVPMLLSIGGYGMREYMDGGRKGFRQGVRDGDTLFGPDFILAVTGAIAGFTIVVNTTGVLS